jgi:nucleotide-binding universal stress UspA family protein
MRVIVATDGSVHARAAASWLATFPLPAATEILVVAAVRPLPAVLEVPFPPVVLDAAASHAREAAEVALATLRPRWPGATARVMDGDPRRVVVDEAAAWRADLVVVGARGVGALSRAMTGSVSTWIAHHAACPVLVVRGQPRPLGTALVACDGSPHARSAAAFLASLPLDHALRVRLVGVVEDTPGTRAPGLVPGVRAAIEDFMQQRRVALGKTLDEVAVAFEAKTALVDRDVRTGAAAAEVLAAAKGADLIVVGARGLGVFDRVMLGSVSDRVLQHAPCPVLLVKSPDVA